MLGLELWLLHWVLGKHFRMPITTKQMVGSSGLANNLWNTCEK